MARKRKFVAPVGAVDGGFTINLDVDERSLIVRLLGELEDLLTAESDERAPILARLFPPAFHDDPEKEAEYQRLMREDLVASRMAAITSVTEILEGDARVLLNEGQTMAFMQAVNAIRLVMGTLLDITDDESAELADVDDSPEHNLYNYLGWLLEWTVRALSGNDIDDLDLL